MRNTQVSVREIQYPNTLCQYQDTVELQETLAAGAFVPNGHHGQQFSTRNRDNDVLPNEHCAQRYKGGWWYAACHSLNLNGLYHGGPHSSYADGVNWYTWRGYDYTP